MIGGGIGGLAAAVSLLRAQFEVDVYEQALQLNEVGGGINMAPNAVCVLHRLGFAEGLDREGVRPRFTHQRRWQDGRTLQRSPLNPLCEELYGAPHMTIHRADLLAVIASGFPTERVHLGHRLVGLADRGNVVEAWFDNGARITADVLVGADGIHSSVRAALFGEKDPAFAGCVAYRGLVPVERIADLGLELGNQSWVGPGGHLVHYPVSRGRLLNFVGWTEQDKIVQNGNANAHDVALRFRQAGRTQARKRPNLPQTYGMSQLDEITKEQQRITRQSVNERSALISTPATTRSANGNARLPLHHQA